jgi:hypothetical protein
MPHKDFKNLQPFTSNGDVIYPYKLRFSRDSKSKQNKINQYFNFKGKCVKDLKDITCLVVTMMYSSNAVDLIQAMKNLIICTTWSHNRGSYFFNWGSYFFNWGSYFFKTMTSSNQLWLHLHTYIKNKFLDFSMTTLNLYYIFNILVWKRDMTFPSTKLNPIYPRIFVDSLDEIGQSQNFKS